MKKVIGVLLVLSVFGAMALGSGSSKSKETKAIVGGSDTKTEANVQEGEKEETTSAAETEAETTIEETVVYDANSIKITAKEYTKDGGIFGGEGIKFLIENNTDKNIRVGVKALIVNNYMMSDLFAPTVAAGMKTNEVLEFSSTSLEKAGITSVGQVEIYFHIYDDDTWDEIDDPDVVVIKTSNYDKMQDNADTSGNVLFEEDGIKIVGKFVDEDSFWGTAIVLYIENTSDKNISIYVDHVSINGFTVDSIFAATVYAGRKSFDDITIFSSDLEKNGITSVDEVSLSFRIRDEESFETIKETDMITFATK